MGGWVFGCDICQEVCPLNESAQPGSERRLLLPEKRQDLDLTALADLTREEYVERFRRSPMKRAKLSGLKRNAALAMGHHGEPRYIEPLQRLLVADEDSVVRSHAAWALVGSIGRRLAEPCGRPLEERPTTSFGGRSRRP